MNKLEKMMNTFLGELVVMTISGMIILPLLDLLYGRFISHTVFQYSFANHMAVPLIIGIAYALVMELCRIKKIRF